MWLLGNNFLAGYEPSAVGAVVGLAWGGGLGFLLGWLTAFLRNFILSVWVAVIGAVERARAQPRILGRDVEHG